METYNFNDLLIITFDAQEDTTALIGADAVYLCAQAITVNGAILRCYKIEESRMKKIGSDLWQIAIWPPSYFEIDGAEITELSVNFQDKSGDTVIKNVSGRDFQILPKCF